MKKYSTVSGKYEEGGEFRPRLVAEDIMARYTFITVSDNKEIYFYDVGIYRDGAEPQIREQCKKLVPDMTIHDISEVMEYIRDMTFVNREKLNDSKTKIWLRNGVFNIETMALEDFAPKPISTVRLPINFRAESDCLMFKKFLSEVLDDSDIPLIQEMVGYCLYKDYPFHKAFMFLGEGANGKSTLLNVVQKFLGDENTASVSLWELSSNRFAPARLYGKLANIYSDIPSTVLKATGQFKMATGQDIMPYEKKHKDAGIFRNYAKLMFSANRLPQSEDNTEAFFRRWNILDFPNTFGPDKADPELLAKLTTDEEMSGLFNWAIVGLKRLLANKQFTYSKTQEQVKAQYIMNSDSLRAFATTNCMRGEATDFVSIDDFYTKYSFFCDDNELEVKSKSLVGRELPTILSYVSVDKTRRIEGKNTRVWVGLRLSDT